MFDRLLAIVGAFVIICLLCETGRDQALADAVKRSDVVCVSGSTWIGFDPQSNRLVSMETGALFSGARSWVAKGVTVEQVCK